MSEADEPEIDAWIEKRRIEAIPRPTESFADETMQQIAEASRTERRPLLHRLAPIAATLVAGIVGFFRLELFLQFLLLNLSY